MRNQNKQVKFKAGIPAPPTFLCPSAKREYQRVAKLMKAAGDEYLQMVDLSTLAMYAQGYADVARLTKSIRADGESVVSDKGNLYQNPNVGALGAAYARMEKASAKLGFSPMDRGKIKEVEAKAEVNRFKRFGKT
jgi:P27 family predicted phage terminase small subunit